MLSTFIRQTVVPYIPEFTRPLRLLASGRSAPFARKIAVDFTVRGYRVKTVETQGELRQVLGLRRAVFHREFAGRKVSFRSDRDVLDDAADHLAIIDLKLDRVAGVYRLLPSFVGHPFYSDSEFDIAPLVALPGGKLELSRACIDRQYRSGVVIALLWKGIAEYAKKIEASYLFGLSSVNSVDLSQLIRIHRHFEQHSMLARDVAALPREKYRIAGFDEAYAANVDAGTLLADLPSLFRTYIKAGARVCSQPVIDHAFNCADWLTVLKLSQLEDGFGRKFMKN